ncbi:hypothetical protein Tco_0512344 [Tanacetum coccineum]
MVSSASSSTKNPPRKLASTRITDISSNVSSLIQGNNIIPITLTTILALSITPPITSQVLSTPPIEASPLAPRALLFTTSSSLPHPYLNSLEDLPPRSSNLPPPPLLNKSTTQVSLILTPWNMSYSFHLLTSQGEEIDFVLNRNLL